MAKDKTEAIEEVIAQPLKDTAVFVWNTIEANAIPRHFSHLDHDGKVLVFASGKTSHTTSLYEVWDNFKIKEVDEK